MSKKARKSLAAYRKSALVASGHTFGQLAALAGVSYSMADKWVHARRNSEKCERAFATLTGKQSVAA